MGHGLQAPALGKNKAGRLKLLVFRQTAAAQSVRVADDGGQRGFQLVGKGSGKIPLLLGGFLQ